MHDGAVVSARAYLPDDPSQRWFGGGLRDAPTVGCNHLVCTRCGETVRQRPGLSWSGPGPDAATLFASADWAALPGVSDTGHAGRVYACKCTRHVATAEHRLDTPDRGPMELSLPWRCAGHPPAAGPLDLAAVRAALAGERPSPVGEGVHAGFAAHDLLDQHPDAASAGLALCEQALDSRDATLARRALDVLARWPDALPVEAPAARLAALDRPDPLWPGRTLAEVYTEALTRAARTRPEAATALEALTA